MKRNKKFKLSKFFSTTWESFMLCFHPLYMLLKTDLKAIKSMGYDEGPAPEDETHEYPQPLTADQLTKRVGKQVRVVSWHEPEVEANMAIVGYKGTAIGAWNKTHVLWIGNYSKTSVAYDLPPQNSK